MHKYLYARRIYHKRNFNGPINATGINSRDNGRKKRIRLCAPQISLRLRFN